MLKKISRVFLYRCLIFKVRFALLRSRSLECLHIISNPEPFVNTFFKVFLKFLFESSTRPGVSVFDEKRKPLILQGFSTFFDIQNIINLTL